MREHFEPNYESRAAVDRLMEAASTKKRGDVIKWEELEAATGIGRTELTRDNGKANGGYIVKRFHDRMLVERYIEIWPVREIGFKLLTAHEQATATFKHRAKRARRQFRKSVRSLTCLTNDPNAHLKLVDQLRVAMELEMSTHNISVLNRQIRDAGKNPPGSESIDRPPMNM